LRQKKGNFKAANEAVLESGRIPKKDYLPLATLTINHRTDPRRMGNADNALSVWPMAKRIIMSIATMLFLVVKTNMMESLLPANTPRR
jgi:hypothetical protein